MSKIIKYYIDIGCIYNGDRNVEHMYYDHQSWDIDYGLIGILKLEIDTKRKTKEEIFFKQIFRPHVHQLARDLILGLVHDKKDTKYNDFDILRKYADADLLVTWNGRDFDIPIVMYNLGYSKKHVKYYLEKITKKDRDLLDLCVLRDISVKGGLEEIVKRLKIRHNLQCKNCPTYTKEEMLFFTDFDPYTNICNNNLKMIKQRNEFDIRLLPELEERLGYLYESRIIQDKFHKKWQSTRPEHNKR